MAPPLPRREMELESKAPPLQHSKSEAPPLLRPESCRFVLNVTPLER